jgi:hypothetical protein
MEEVSEKQALEGKFFILYPYIYSEFMKYVLVQKYMKNSTLNSGLARCSGSHL